jgi:hypothetical protein
MSPDEVLALIVSAALALAVWGSWYAQSLRVGPLLRRTAAASAPDVAPLLSIGILYGILRRFASFDVRDSGVYLFFYCVMGAGWLALGTLLMPLFNLSRRDDVLERSNPAAGWCIGGALLGLTLCFAGANIGDGPGWWVVVFCAALSTAGLFFLWACLDRLTGASEAITVERDLASGIRAGGFFIAAGLILGRAVAGDWTSAAAAVSDFFQTGWPAVTILAVAAAAQRLFRPTVSQPAGPPLAAGVLPALVYVALGAAILTAIGWWR